MGSYEVKKGVRMKNLQVSWMFRQIADLMELKGEPSYKARAYRKAAKTIESLPVSIEEYSRGDRLLELPGVGVNLARKIKEILETGRCSYLEQLKEEVPPGLLDVLQVPGIGTKTAVVIYRSLGITSLDELERQARAGKLREIPRLGRRLEEKILAGIEFVKRKDGRVLLGWARPVAEGLAAALREEPAVEGVALAGSVRRWRETIGDIDLLAASREPDRVMNFFTGLPVVERVLARDSTTSSVVVETGFQVNLRVVEPRSFATALQYFTGSVDHNLQLRRLATEKGFKLSEYDLEDADGGKVLIREEAEIYARLGLPFIPPELREGRGEIEAAIEGQLPRLVEPGDIKGDLHVHTRWSDGACEIEEMVEAARKKGYQYLAICDHSKSLAVANGLDEKRLARQREVIAELNQRYDDFTVLAGVEVDIRKDGTLDFPDEVLGELDIVVASIHTGFGQGREEITRRVFAALDHPLVDILAHPTGRLMGKRRGYEVDLEAVIARAAEKGKVLEINASPDRLDLSDVYVRKAVQQGVPVVINTDAHSIYALDDMVFGIAVARRGWCEKGDVINTLPVVELLEWLGGRRRGLK